MVATRGTLRKSMAASSSSGSTSTTTTRSSSNNNNGKKSTTTTTTTNNSSTSTSWFLWNSLYLSVLLAAPIKYLLDIPSDSFPPKNHDARYFILQQLVLAVAGGIAVVHMVHVMGDYCRRKGQTGKDLCKKGTPAGEVPIPESQGLAPGIIYLVVIIVCQLLEPQASPEQLANYNSSMLSICFMLFLGFVDDVLVSALQKSPFVATIFSFFIYLSTHT